MNQPAEATTPAAGAPALRVLINTHDLVVLTIGMVIGSGIFLVPGLFCVKAAELSG